MSDANVVPYETLARAEADAILEGSLPNILWGLSTEHQIALQELLADAYHRGLEAGFNLSDTSLHEPITVIEAYYEGYNQGKKEK